MSSREALLAALALAAFGTASTAGASTPPDNLVEIGASIAASEDPGELRRYVGDPLYGPLAVGRLLEVEGKLRQGETNASAPVLLSQACLYKPGDPRYRSDPRCPPLGGNPGIFILEGDGVGNEGAGGSGYSG